MSKSSLFFLWVVCALTFVVHPLFGTAFNIVFLPFLIRETIEVSNSFRDEEETPERRRFSLGAILFLSYDLLKSLVVLFRTSKYFFIIFIVLFFSLLLLPRLLEKHEIISIPSSSIGRSLPEEIRREVQNQIPGFLTIDIPSHMVVQEEALGKVCITQIANAPCSEKNETSSQTKRIRTSSIMEVILKGYKFDIEALNREEQAVTGIHSTEWNWQIIPLQSGKQSLTLRASLWLMEVNSRKEIYQDLELEILTIDVRYNFINEISKTVSLYGIPLLNVFLLLFLFLFILKRIRKVKPLVVNFIKLGSRQMSGDRHINTGGGNYIESNTGSYVQGNYINMSQNLPDAAKEIQDLIDQLQRRGATVDTAQDQVAQDIARQAQNNSTMKEKLLNWGQALGDATVSDVVKGAVKLAIRSAGIPLP